MKFMQAAFVFCLVIPILAICYLALWGIELLERWRYAIVVKIQPQKTAKK